MSDAIISLVFPDTTVAQDKPSQAHFLRSNSVESQIKLFFNQNIFKLKVNFFCLKILSKGFD